jgi:epsilon-lactone hydrolase
MGAAIELPPERPGYPAWPDLALRRDSILKPIADGTWKTVSPTEETEFAGVAALCFRPKGAVRATILHFHGGGFRLGCPQMMSPFAAAFAESCGVEMVCPTYRLAPEHPFPAGLNDVRKVLSALREQGRGQVILAGDSAGGGLAASLTALCVAEGKPPAGLILLSAWLDLTVSSDCYESNAATDPLFSRAIAEQAVTAYLQGISAQHPLASPLLGSVGGFPPTFISVGDGEVLAEDSRRFHAALHAAGIAAELLEIPGMEHTAVARNPALAGAAETHAALTGFIDRLLAAA